MQIGIGIGLNNFRKLGTGGTGPIISAPSQFMAAQWTLTDSPSAGGDTLSLNVTELPSNGGSAITALQYSVGGGAAQTLSGVGTGARLITVLASTAASVELWAVNAVGSGTRSTAKVATPTVTAGLITVSEFSYSLADGLTRSPAISLTSSAEGTAHFVTGLNGFAPTVAQIIAGSGGGILDKQSVSISSGGGSYPITLTNEAAQEMQVYIVNGSGSSGTPSAENQTKIGGIIVDNTAPVISESTPADNATGVSTGRAITITFDSSVYAGAGTFTLYRPAGPASVEVFTPSTGAGSAGGTVSITGAMVTLTPSASLLGGTGYSVRWSADAVYDRGGNSIAANSDDTVMNFTTAATSVAPTILSNNSYTANDQTLSGDPAGVNTGMLVSVAMYDNPKGLSDIYLTWGGVSMPLLAVARSSDTTPAYDTHAIFWLPLASYPAGRAGVLSYSVDGANVPNSVIIDAKEISGVKAATPAVASFGAAGGAHTVNITTTVANTLLIGSTRPSAGLFSTLAFTSGVTGPGPNVQNDGRTYRWGSAVIATPATVTVETNAATSIRSTHHAIAIQPV